MSFQSLPSGSPGRPWKESSRRLCKKVQEAFQTDDKIVISSDMCKKSEAPYTLVQKDLGLVQIKKHEG